MITTINKPKPLVRTISSSLHALSPPRTHCSGTRRRPAVLIGVCLCTFQASCPHATGKDTMHALLPILPREGRSKFARARSSLPHPHSPRSSLTAKRSSTAHRPRLSPRRPARPAPPRPWVGGAGVCVSGEVLGLTPVLTVALTMS